MSGKVWDRFTWGDQAVSFRGLHDPSIRWNGWAFPSFPLGEALRILETIYAETDQTDDEIGYKVIDGVISVCDDGSDGSVTWLPLGSVMVDGVEMFAIGSGGWVWDEVRIVEEDGE